MINFYNYSKRTDGAPKDLYLQLFDATKKIDNRKAMVLDLMKKDMPVRQQAEYFNQMTGQSGRTFLRLKKKIKDELGEVTK